MLRFKNKRESYSNLTNQKISELQKLRLQAEIENKRLDAEIDLNRRRLDYQHTLDMAQAQNRPTTGHPSVNASVSNPSSQQRIDVLVKLVPRFDPSDVHLFFTSFERAVEINKISRVHWPALLHAVASGKAQRVLSSLTLSDAQDYDVIKESLLIAFDVCAEIFRKRFRNITKNANETFAEYSFKIKESFDRWLFKSEVKDFVSLQQLILLERFNESFVDDPDLSMWMLNKAPRTLSDAARLADEFSTLRRATRVSKKYESKTSVGDGKQPPERYNNNRDSLPVMQTVSGSETVEKKWKHSGSAPNVTRAPPAATIHCAYCKKPGHGIATCYKLKNKNENTSTRGGSYGDPSVHLVSTLNNLNELQTRRKEKVDVRFRPHCFEVTMVRPNQTEFQIMCLRDTAALQSLIRDFHSSTESIESSQPYVVTHDVRHICSIGGVRITVPLVQVDVRSEQLSGSFELGVCNNLPAGIDLLAGNDLFTHQEEVYVVTRSQTASQRASDKLTTLAENVDFQNDEVAIVDAPIVSQENSSGVFDESAIEGIAELFDESNRVRLLSSIDRTTLIELQQSDLSLKKYCERACELQDSHVTEQFYFKSGVLMRRWSHRSQPADTGNGQIVAPSAIRRQLLLICHDIPASGHLGIRKSLDRLLRHFWWNSIQADVREYVRTCHQCQCVGKGAKNVIAPLYSMPIVSEPWSVCAIDIVGPLNICDGTGNRFILTVLDLCTHIIQKQLL